MIDEKKENASDYSSWPLWPISNQNIKAYNLQTSIQLSHRTLIPTILFYIKFLLKISVQ